MTTDSGPLAEIRRLYYATTKASVVRDLDRAIDLLKALPDEESRARATVYMEGLAAMRSEWGVARTPSPGGAPSRPARPRRTRR